MSVYSRFRRSVLSLVLLSTIIIFSSCSSNTPVVNEEDPVVSENVVPEDNINSENVQEEVSSPTPQKTDESFKLPVKGVRPYAVMIDNEGTKSLPQGGLNLAQIIYEVIVEGGETRLMPVFWEQDASMIGPVRSSRHYFLDYAMEHDAIYVHFGWSPMAMNDISKFKINNINGVANGGEVFWDITKDRKNWQDSYTSMQKVKDYVTKVKYRTETDKEIIFKYSDDDYSLVSDNDASTINLRYSSGYTSGFTYDENNKTYLRERKGKPHMERVTGEQLRAKNIIIQMVKNYTIKGDTSGRQEVNTVGSGDGYFVTNGKYVKIKWSKKSRTERTQYTDSEGKEIVLNQGQTWIQIVPVDGKVDIK